MIRHPVNKAWQQVVRGDMLAVVVRMAERLGLRQVCVAAMEANTLFTPKRTLCSLYF